VLIAIAAISLLRFTPSEVALILKINKKPSTKTPKRKENKKVNGPKAGLPSAVRRPPTAPT
jgi:hypothetical protein